MKLEDTTSRNHLSASSLVATCAFVIALLILPALAPAQDDVGERGLQITRAARPWEFLGAVGQRAAILGNESGQVEAWVYPLKILRDLRLIVHSEGRVIPAAALVRTIETRPESTTLLYAGDSFSVRETFFTPVDQAGAVIELEIDAARPLQIEVVFRSDLQLAWPAALGASHIDWDPRLQAFALSEDTGKFVAYVGSPAASEPMLEYQTNYSRASESALKLVAAQGRASQLVVIAGSTVGAAHAQTIYRTLARQYRELRRASSAYYADYLSRTVRVELPDSALRAAYDWASIRLAQALVSIPALGTGLVAGYGASGVGQRPGFAWFFGRDTFWSAFALNSIGDFGSSRQALDFIAQLQRADGKIPHEIPQSARYVDWFQDYPYGYASADATPLYLIAMNDYVRRSADLDSARASWDRLQRADRFLRSTYDAAGIAQNAGVGHGWVEGGPLLPVKAELYQSALAVESLRALASLTRLIGKMDESAALLQQFDTERSRLNRLFWSADRHIYAFALDAQGQRVEEASVLASVPMWFGLLDTDRSAQMISKLSGAEHQTDWGMRLISNMSPRYSGAGYHFGSVWPLFTGWAAVAEYRYHRPHAAYQNLRANALLTLDGSSGRATEVLSGDHYQPLSTSSPQQTWSAAMVVTPLLRGMLGLQLDAPQRTLTIAPHVPADWRSLAIRGVRAKDTAFDFAYERSEEALTLTVDAKGEGDWLLAFQPALSLRAQVLGVEVNERPVPFEVQANDADQHLMLQFVARSGPNTVRIRTRHDVGVSYAGNLPPLGETSAGLRIVDESWNAARDRLTLALEGWTGQRYALALWNASELAAVEGAELLTAADGSKKLRVVMPAGDGTRPVDRAITLHFVPRQSPD